MLGDVREPTSHLCPVDCTVTTDTSLDDVLKADVVTTDGQVHQSRIVREILEGLDLQQEAGQEVADAVVDLAGDAGALGQGSGVEPFRDCVTNEKHKDDIATNTSRALKLGVTGLPYMIVNDYTTSGFGGGEHGLKTLLKAGGVQ